MALEAAKLDEYGNTVCSAGQRGTGQSKTKPKDSTPKDDACIHGLELRKFCTALVTDLNGFHVKSHFFRCMLVIHMLRPSFELAEGGNTTPRAGRFGSDIDDLQ